MKQILFIYIFFHSCILFACAGAYQFKIFPVETDNGKIITIDVMLNRTDVEEIYLNSTIENYTPLGERWLISGYISVYDKYQKVISKKLLDSTYSIGFFYSDTLNSLFLRGYEYIKLTYPKIDLFRPEYISFCDFQQTCNLLTTIHDTISRKNYIIHDQKKYEVPALSDSTYYALDTVSKPFGNISDFYINSIRIFKSKTTTLLITHLAVGDDITMGLLTTDPAMAGETEDTLVRLLKEYRPEFSFTNLKLSTYEEPVMYHGYGFDIFITK